LAHTTWPREQLRLWQRPPKPEAPPPPTPRKPQLRRRTAEDDKLYTFVEAQDSVTLLDYLTDTRYNVNVFDDLDVATDVIGPEYNAITNMVLIKQKEVEELDVSDSEDSEDEGGGGGGGGLLGERQTEVPIITKPSTRTPLLVEVAARGHARMVNICSTHTRTRVK
jgi:hypothetical protein